MNAAQTKEIARIEVGMIAFTPRYAAYAKAHGASPDAMLERDAAEYPGGKMAGYIVWIGQMLRAWRAECSMASVMSQDHHEAFDSWLNKKAEAA